MYFQQTLLLIPANLTTTLLFSNKPCYNLTNKKYTLIVIFFNILNHLVESYHFNTNIKILLYHFKLLEKEEN